VAVSTEDRTGDPEPAFFIRGELDNLALLCVDPLIDIELPDRDSVSNILGGHDESDVIPFSDRNRLWLEGVLSSDHLDFSLGFRLLGERYSGAGQKQETCGHPHKRSSQFAHVDSPPLRNKKRFEHGVA